MDSNISLTYSKKLTERGTVSKFTSLSQIKWRYIHLLREGEGRVDEVDEIPSSPLYEVNNVFNGIIRLLHLSHLPRLLQQLKIKTFLQSIPQHPAWTTVVTIIN